MKMAKWLENRMQEVRDTLLLSNMSFLKLVTFFFAIFLFSIMAPSQSVADSVDADGSTTSYSLNTGELKQKNFRANSGDVVVLAFSNSSKASVNFDIVFPDGKLECGFGGCFTGASEGKTSLHYIRAAQTGTYAINFNLRDASASGIVRLSVWNANQYGIQIKSSVTQVSFSTSDILKVIAIPSTGGQALSFGLANRANSTVNYDVYGKGSGALCGFGGCFTGPSAGSTTLKTFTPQGADSGFMFLALALRDANGSGAVSVSLPSFTGNSTGPSPSSSATPSSPATSNTSNSGDSKIQSSIDQANRITAVAQDAANNLAINTFTNKEYADAIATANKAIDSANKALAEAQAAAKSAKASEKNAAESQVEAAKKAVEAAKSAKEAATYARAAKSALEGVKDAAEAIDIASAPKNASACQKVATFVSGAVGVAGAIAAKNPIGFALGSMAVDTASSFICKG